MRVNHQSLDSPLLILANQALEIIAAGKSLRIARAPRSAEYIDVEPTGLAVPVTDRQRNRGYVTG